MGTGWSWLRIGTDGGRLWVRWRTFGFHKMRGISWLAAKPVSFSRRTLLRGVSKYKDKHDFVALLTWKEFQVAYLPHKDSAGNGAGPDVLAKMTNPCATGNRYSEASLEPELGSLNCPDSKCWITEMWKLFHEWAVSSNFKLFTPAHSKPQIITRVYLLRASLIIRR